MGLSAGLVPRPSLVLPLSSHGASSPGVLALQLRGAGVSWILREAHCLPLDLEILTIGRRREWPLRLFSMCEMQTCTDVFLKLYIQMCYVCHLHSGHIFGRDGREQATVYS